MKNNIIEPTCRLGGAVISDRIVADILESMRNGELSQVERLPAEVDLAESMGVSRTVIRDALSELEREGYIERVRGIGTVVNREVLRLRSRLDQKLEYYPLIRSFGSYPHADSFQFFSDVADADTAELLNIPVGAPLLCIKKRVLADTKPVIYSINYLPKSLFGNRDISRIDLTPSVFEVLEKECGQQPASTVAHIRASYGDESIRSSMRLAPDDALLLLDEVCYNRLCKPIMRSFSYYTNFFDFSILRKML